MSEPVVDTWVTTPSKPVSTRADAACLVHIYPTGKGMGSRYELDDESITIGRSPSCDICADDHSVSRRHAAIEATENGYRIVDLKSTNGTFVNDEPVTSRELRDGDYVRIGNFIFRFLMGGNVEAEYHEEIYRLTILDGLTEAHNKRYLLEFLDRELARSMRHRRPLAVVIFDVDHFKRINDDFGHLIGDFALRELIGRIRREIRRDELLARYGGEEFVAVLPETTVDSAVQFAERIRKLVSQSPMHIEGLHIQLTISLGVAATKGDEKLTSLELLQQADQNLLRAKRLGRNCVVS